MTKVRITMSLDEGLIARIDKERGLIPRSAYVEHMLNNADLSKVVRK